MLRSVVAISVGASAGAVARWMLALGLNALLPTMRLGTLAANLIGGYLMGLAIAGFAQHTSLAPYWQLLLVTGFLGGLTTFSAFSGEVALLLRDGRLYWAVATIAAHVVGSLLMTALGLASYALVRRIA